MIAGVGTNKSYQRIWQSADLPSPTVLTAADGSGGSGWILEDGKPDMRESVGAAPQASAKPPYTIPSMAEIAAVTPNGYRVISSFSGCGGSCLGFKMAGFRVLWANEFIPAAADTYRANHPDTPLDVRDIRSIQAPDVLSAAGIASGEVDVMEGSPPCASFSLAGKREAGWGKVRSYSDSKQRTDDLFFEYARLLRGIQPKVLVAENVSGLVRGTAKGYFKEILSELKSCGYRVRAQVLDAQWLGVPQMRQRVIFIGVRQDLGIDPVFPQPFPYRYSVRDALPWIIRHGRHPSGTYTPEMVDSAKYPSGAILTTEAAGVGLVEVDIPYMDPDAPGAQPNVPATIQKRKFTIPELKRICSFPEDFILTGTEDQQWERMGRAVPPLMMRAIATTVRDEILARLPR